MNNNESNLSKYLEDESEDGAIAEFTVDDLLRDILSPLLDVDQPAVNSSFNLNDMVAVPMDVLQEAIHNASDSANFFEASFLHETVVSALASWVSTIVDGDEWDEENGEVTADFLIDVVHSEATGFVYFVKHNASADDENGDLDEDEEPEDDAEDDAESE